MAHSSVGPSGSHRWINCPGSVDLIADARSNRRIKPDRPTIYTDEGTAAHMLAEDALRTGDPVDDALCSVIKLTHAITVDREMCEHAQGYVDFVRAQLRNSYSVLLVEEQVSYTDWVPDGFGTADAVILDDDCITVIDLKYGQGVLVNAVGNSQALLYAMGVWLSLDQIERAGIKTVRMVIYQPR